MRCFSSTRIRSAALSRVAVNPPPTPRNRFGRGIQKWADAIAKSTSAPVGWVMAKIFQEVLSIFQLR
jgi:hypothetical protein